MTTDSRHSILKAPPAPSISTYPFSSLAQGYWRMHTWKKNTQDHLRFLEQHIDLGITTVDHAHVYGSPSCESIFGDALKCAPNLRNKIHIVTKCGIELPRTPTKLAYYDSSRSKILASVECSLKRLQVEHIDLLLLHRPDMLLNADEVADTFKQLHDSGKVSYFGVSNFNRSEFELLQSRLAYPLITNQVEINILNTQTIDSGILNHLQSQRIRPMAWSCLAGGALLQPNKYIQPNLMSELLSIKDELCLSDIAQVFYSWVLRLPSAPIPILGSGNIQRTKLAIDTLPITMSREQWYRLLCASKNEPLP